MKFEKKTTLDGALIPRSALKLSQIGEREEIELHTLPSALVVLKRRMTAVELIQAIDSLKQLSSQLTDHLVVACGPCEKCSEDVGGCPYEEDDDPMIIPDQLRFEANIPMGAKLCATPLCGESKIIITVAGHQHDLDDVPNDIVEALSARGACLGELDEMLMQEEVIYGRGK